MAEHNTLDDLSDKIDILLEKDSDLTQEERTVLKQTLKIMVALRRLGRLGWYILLGSVVLFTNWERLKSYIQGNILPCLIVSALIL